MKRERSRWAAVTAGMAMVTAIAGCGGGGAGGASDDPYKIGMSMDLSGAIAFNGKPAAAGLRAYVSDLNKRGGVNGRKVDLKILDDGSDVAKGRVNIQQFSSEKRLAIFGFILSNLSLAGLPVAESRKTPIVGLGGPGKLFEPVKSYFFSYELRAERLESAILNYIATRTEGDGIEKPRVAVFSVDTPSNRDMVELAVKNIKSRGWTHTTTQYMPVAPTDVTAQAAEIKASDPDYVLLSHNDAGSLVAVRGLRAQGVTVPVINQWAGSADATLKQLGENYIAFRTYASPTEKNNPAVDAMKEAATKAGEAESMTNPYFTQGWVAGSLIEQTLKKCGQDCPSGEKFRDALEGLGEIDTNGLSGPLTVGPESHEMVSTVRFFTWDKAGDTAKPLTDWIKAFE
ncbi:ABC-type branched-chain amino acid transport system, substrate-binding protein [Thermomonospora echinospora]|uniref:ABC-type branched-chain amino acid transport system, substrate-binding protein n=1 Tax=Thermomonospora echinospora TaxID=1992 RepID=A0A1H6ALE1_9ACTN|nr:ABC transporter substrate-binding protein [Thermomonospora echinospora]SEG49538.1 ABC-type branched-chain amino acid transport system, substrate-binding protein [Thermomonospora echinospora]